MLCYCKKCGRVVRCDNLNESCDYCHSVVYPVPDEYLYDKVVITKDLKQKLIEELVKTSPEFDQYLFDHRDEDLRNRRMKNEAALAHGRAILEGKDKGNSYGVSCPYCQATNVKKISGLSKAGSVALFGIFAIGKTSKQWHCDHCGSDF